MNKDQLIAAVHARHDHVLVTGFGTFKPVTRAARTGRNPRTGAPAPIPARTGLRFTPGAALSRAVASGVAPDGLITVRGTQ